MLNLNVITILMKWRQLKLIHWDTNYFAQSFTSLSDPRLTVRVPPSMKIHLHDNNSEHSECSTLVRATKAANLGIKAFELDSRSTECKAHWKYFLFFIFFTIILQKADPILRKEWRWMRSLIVVNSRTKLWIYIIQTDIGIWKVEQWNIYWYSNKYEN